MNKFNIETLCNKTLMQINDICQYYDSTMHLYLGANYQKELEKKLSTLVFHRAYVTMEGFLSDYYIGCINRAPGKFHAARQGQIVSSIKSKYSEWEAKNIAFTHPPMTVDDVISILDKDGYNITFPNYADFIQHASTYLSSHWSAKISSVLADARAAYDLAKHIRNCIAHESDYASQKMNDALRTEYNRDATSGMGKKSRDTNDIGAYLLSVKNGKKRIHIFFDYFSSIITKLAP